MMIETTRQQIKELLADAINPALMCSFGKDSLLLLRLTQDAGFKGAIYYLGDDISKLAETVILENDLTVISWPAADRYLVPDGNRLAQVDEYLVGSKVVPVVSPIVEGENCGHGKFQPYRRPFHYPHDVTLTGYKKGETCDAVGMAFPAEMDIGVTKLVSPLYEWTDDDVYEACEQLGIQYEDNDTVEFCDGCLNAIINSDWDKQAALTGFRQRFSFNH